MISLAVAVIALAALSLAAFCVAGFAIRVRADQSIQDGFLMTTLVLALLSGLAALVLSVTVLARSAL